MLAWAITRSKYRICQLRATVATATMRDTFVRA